MSALDLIREEMDKMNNVQDINSVSEVFEERMINLGKGFSEEEDFSFEENVTDPIESDIDSFIVGEPIAITYNTSEEIEIGEIRDVHGKLSERVDELMLKTGSTVIPFEATGLLSQVVEFKNHDIFVLNGERFVMSRNIRKDVMDKFKESIINTLKSGLPYTKVLTIDVIVGTESYATLMLNEAEWSYICSLFRRYNARVFQDKEGQLVLKVG